MNMNIAQRIVVIIGSVLIAVTVFAPPTSCGFAVPDHLDTSELYSLWVGIIVFTAGLYFAFQSRRK